MIELAVCLTTYTQAFQFFLENYDVNLKRNLVKCFVKHNFTSKLFQLKSSQLLNQINEAKQFTQLVCYSLNFLQAAPIRQPNNSIYKRIRR